MTNPTMTDEQIKQAVLKALFQTAYDLEIECKTTDFTVDVADAFGDKLIRVKFVKCGLPDEFRFPPYELEDALDECADYIAEEYLSEI